MQRLEDISVYLLGKSHCLCSGVGYYSYECWQLFTAGSNYMQMFMLDVSSDDHGLFFFCTYADTPSKS